jgi:hypothetical protein
LPYAKAQSMRRYPLSIAALTASTSWSGQSVSRGVTRGTTLAGGLPGAEAEQRDLRPIGESGELHCTVVGR